MQEANEKWRDHISVFQQDKEYAELSGIHHKPEGRWDQQANQMIEQFQQSGHPIFRGTSALDRGTLKRQSGRNTIHFTADSGNIE